MPVSGGDSVRRRSGVRRLAVLATAGVLVVLGACSEDPPKPEALETPSSSPTATASRTSSPDTAPTLPPEARGTSKKSAEAFVRYAIEVLNYTAATLDVGPLGDLAATQCSACTRIVKSTAAIKRQGGRIDGGKWTVVQALALQTANDEQPKVLVGIEAAPQVVVESAGERPKRYPAGKTAFTFELKHHTGGWQIVRITGGDQ
jgi:hypothetical protein